MRKLFLSKPNINSAPVSQELFELVHPHITDRVINTKSLSLTICGTIVTLGVVVCALHMRADPCTHPEQCQLRGAQVDQDLTHPLQEHVLLLHHTLRVGQSANTDMY